MASSRYDNIKYFNGSSWVIPKEIKVFNGTSWISYGEKNSTSNKKIKAFTSPNTTACFTYVRRDVNIPAFIQLGNGNKYIDMYDTNSTVQQVDTYNSGYNFEFQAEIYATTPLYTVNTKNNGDIYAAAYTNIIAEVFNGDQIRIIMGSRWRGITIDSRKNVNQAYSQKYTGFVGYVGERLSIHIERYSTTGNFTIRVTRPNGSQTTHYLSMSTQWVTNPNGHRLGAQTVDDYGNISVYGNAKLYYFGHTINSNRTVFEFSTDWYGNGTTRVGEGHNGFADCRNTSVKVEHYTVYDRQS